MSAKINRAILKVLRDGPKWARSIPPAYKPLLNELVGHGYVERIKPEGGAARNMLRLTDKGQATVSQFA